MVDFILLLASMAVLNVIAFTVVFLYFLATILLFLFQHRLLFQPGKLSASFRYRADGGSEEVFIDTRDGEKINALFFAGVRNEVILYFHGNAGDLSGWQFVGEDFTRLGFSILLIDYRGYGKSTGKISEKGLYLDAHAAYEYLINAKEFLPNNIIVYGRSLGTGCAVQLACDHQIGGLVLEAPYTSIPKLANEKVPFFFPSLYLRFRFDNLSKINKVKVPVIFIHGTKDELIPPAHSEKLANVFNGKKKRIMVKGGSHNDLTDFDEYRKILAEKMLTFFGSV